MNRTPVRIGTAERESTFFTQGLALKTVLEKSGRLGPVEVCESEHASIENANRIHRGDLEFGFMAANWIGRARRGEAPFTHPMDIRVAAPMNAGPLFFIVRANSDIQSISGLRGRRVAIGAAGSGMVQHADVIFAALGLRFADFSPIYLDFAAGADALAAGEIDAQFQCPIPNNVMTALSERLPVRVIPLTSQELDKVLSAVPYYRPTVMRRGAIAGLDVDLPQIGVVNVLVTHARLDEALVREVVSAIIAGVAVLPKLSALFTGLDSLLRPLRSKTPPQEVAEVPLHPGAAAAYREAALVT